MFASYSSILKIYSVSVWTARKAAFVEFYLKEINGVSIYSVQGKLRCY